jgi:hypothetical protein
MANEWSEDPLHPVLPRSFEYEIIGVRLEREPLDEIEPFLDLTLRRGDERRVLRFWSPTNLEIERGGPVMTSGFVIYDIRARGWSGLGVQVDDVEPTPGAVRFYARAVEEIS